MAIAKLPKFTLHLHNGTIDFTDCKVVRYPSKVEGSNVALIGKVVKSDLITVLVGENIIKLRKSNDRIQAYSSQNEPLGQVRFEDDGSLKIPAFMLRLMSY